MKLNQDKVPANLEEALILLKEGMTPEDIIEFKKCTPRQRHLEVGGILRSDWSLWETSNIISVWFKKEYKVDHADDVSGIILECLMNDLNNEPRKDKVLAKKFIEHRKRQK